MSDVATFDDVLREIVKRSPPKAGSPDLQAKLLAQGWEALNSWVNYCAPHPIEIGTSFPSLGLAFP